jgi:hypothetical protein
LESAASKPKRNVELMSQEATDVEPADVEPADVDADKSFRFNKTLVDLKLSKSVKIDIDINLLYFVMIFLNSFT